MIEPSTLVESRTPARRGSGAASRWALAASVAILAGICWYAGSGTKTEIVSPNDAIGQATAGDGPILDEMSRHKALPDMGESMP